MRQAVEQITPYGDGVGKGEQVREMFDNIAPAYDFMNRAMTLGIDRRWRRKAVDRVARHLAGTGEPCLLDVATGTGDFALQLLRHVAGARVTGIDLSEAMLDVARRKAGIDAADGRVTFTRGDCMALPCADGAFDAVTVAFGVRNFEHLEQGYREMWRVLRPGGFLCVLELSVPGNRVIRRLYDLYTRQIIPRVGALKSGDSNAYRYLPQSIAAVPQGEAMLDIMRRAGFTACRAATMTLGVCSLYTAVK